MAMTYAEIRERIVQGVVRGAAPDSLDRVRMQVDAAFFQINSTTAEAFAGHYEFRELLRAERSLTFTAGSAPLSSDVLKKYIVDGTFTVTPATGQPTPHYAYRKYADYIRNGDPRLGKWTTIGESVLATTPQTLNVGAIPLVGAATLTAICSPPIPATENDDFEAPDDFYPEFINTGILFIRGQPMEQAVVIETA